MKVDPECAKAERERQLRHKLFIQDLNQGAKERAIAKAKLWDRFQYKEIR